MRLAASLERAAAQDRRRFTRLPVEINAGLGPAERPSSPVTVFDLSTHGCGIELRSHAEPGARVWIKLPGLEAWSSRIVWADGERAGLEFDRPLHPAVVGRYR